jgi:hypothetical protein
VLVKGIEECFLGQVLVVFKFWEKTSKNLGTIWNFFVSNRVEN